MSNIKVENNISKNIVCLEGRFQNSHQGTLPTKVNLHCVYVHIHIPQVFLLYGMLTKGIIIKCYTKELAVWLHFYNGYFLAILPRGY